MYVWTLYVHPWFGGLSKHKWCIFLCQALGGPRRRPQTKFPYCFALISGKNRIKCQNKVPHLFSSCAYLQMRFCNDCFLKIAFV